MGTPTTCRYASHGYLSPQDDCWYHHVDQENSYSSRWTEESIIFIFMRPIRLLVNCLTSKRYDATVNNFRWSNYLDSPARAQSTSSKSDLPTIISHSSNDWCYHQSTRKTHVVALYDRRHPQLPQRIRRLIHRHTNTGESSCATSAWPPKACYSSGALGGNSTEGESGIIALYSAIHCTNSCIFLLHFLTL